MVHLWIKNGVVVYHTNTAAAAQIDGLTRPPDQSIPEDAYYSANGMARVINGGIVLGKLPEEIADEERQEEIAAKRAELAAIDAKAGAGRMARGTALAAAREAGVEKTEGGDYDRLDKLEARAELLRIQLRELESQADLTP